MKSLRVKISASRVTRDTGRKFIGETSRTEGSSSSSKIEWLDHSSYQINETAGAILYIVAMLS